MVKFNVLKAMEWKATYMEEKFSKWQSKFWDLVLLVLLCGIKEDGTGLISEIKDISDGPTDYCIFYRPNLLIHSDIFKEIFIT